MSITKLVIGGLGFFLLINLLNQSSLTEEAQLGILAVALIYFGARS